MRRGAGAALAAAALLLAGCGGAAEEAPLTVFAAASLTETLRELAPEARANVGGSDELATQLREGARADVFLSASARYTQELFREGIVERPVEFATNRIVLIVPADNPAEIARVEDAARPGTRVVLGGEGVPAGDYARRTLAALRLDAVLEQVVSHEKDVKGVVGKVALGEADAGFVYATDALAAADRVRTLELPAQEAVAIRYEAAVVTESERQDDAERLVGLLLAPEGRALLRRAGFGLP